MVLSIAISILLVLFVVALYLLFKQPGPAFDLIAIAGTDHEYFYGYMAQFFLRQWEKPVIATRSMLCLIDGSSLKPLKTSSSASLLTSDEVSTVSPFLKFHWKGTRVCVFRNCAHADEIHKRAETRRAWAEHMHLHPEALERGNRRPDETVPPAF